MEFLITDPIKGVLIAILGVIIGWLLCSLLTGVQDEKPSNYNNHKTFKKVKMFSKWYSELTYLCSSSVLKKLKTSLGIVVTFVGADGTISATKYNIDALETDKSTRSVETYFEDMLMVVKLSINFTINVNGTTIYDDIITVPLNANEYERNLVKDYLLSAVYDAIIESKIKVKKTDLKELKNTIEELNINVDQHLNKIRSNVIGVRGERLEEITKKKN